MSRSLGTVKSEIRILGLDTCNPEVTIGAVVRGSLYLDGVVTFPRDIDEIRLARKIRETKYFPELRVIMIHQPKRNLKSEAIQRIARLPVIEISLSRATHQSVVEVSGDGRGNVRTRSGLDRATLAKVLALTQARRSLPEPLRIAHLLAKLHIFGRLSHDKG